MSTLVEFRCPEHGRLVDTFPSASVRCRCGAKAKSEVPYLRPKPKPVEPRKQTYANEQFIYDLQAALAAADRPADHPLFADRVAHGDFARETTYGYGIPTKPDLRLVSPADVPTREQLAKHTTRFGQAGVAEVLASLPADETSDELARKSELAEIKQRARKRSKRRRNIEQEAKALLARKPELMPAAVADALNISDRRAKALVEKVASSDPA